MNISDIVRRITGISTPIFGVSWNPPDDERKYVRQFVKFLEDRRVLFNPYFLEVESQVVSSLCQIREKTNETLGALPDDSNASGPIKAIRAACRRFLDGPRVRFHYEHHMFRHGMAGGDIDSGFFVALGELRATVGMRVAILAATYGLNLDDELVSILPAEDRE